MTPIRLAVDATPLIGKPTGVGAFVRDLLDALGPREELTTCGYALSARNADVLRTLLPTNVYAGRELSFPASGLLRLWKHSPWPPAECWVGEVDIVHGTNFVVPPTRGASVVTVHDLTAIRYPHMCTPTTLRYPHLIKKAVRRGAHIHVPTHAMATDVCNLLEIERELIHVITLGLPRVDTPGSTHSSNRRYVLAVGTIEPRKDYSTLLAAFDAVASKVDDVDLVIVGSRGWGTEMFDTALARIKHRERVRCLGHVSDAARSMLLRNASLLAFPSLYEGFGLPPLEAMQLDVPVVATANPAVSEVIGDAGLLTRVGDIDAFAGSMLSVLEDEAVSTDLITKGRERIKHFDWTRSAGQFVDLYQELVDAQ